jgi:phage gp37-like protein
LLSGAADSAEADSVAVDFTGQEFVPADSTVAAHWRAVGAERVLVGELAAGQEAVTDVTAMVPAGASLAPQR